MIVKSQPYNKETMKKKKTLSITKNNHSFEFKYKLNLHKQSEDYFENSSSSLLLVNKDKNNMNSMHLNSIADHISCHPLKPKQNVSILVISMLILCLIECMSRPAFASSLHMSSSNSNNNNNKLAPLYWVTNNRKFYESTNENYYLKLNAHIGDNIDLVCPKQARTGTANESSSHYHKNNHSVIDQSELNQAHYLTIYKVGSKYEFDNCIINPNNIETVPILKCDKPSINTKFTIYFVKYSPVPFALEFEEDKEYFFLSTSSGTKDGLNFMTGGLCSKFNMRFSIKINAVSSESQQITINSSLVKKHELHNQAAASASSSQLLSDEDSIILQQLKERIKSTVASLNSAVNRNDDKSASEQLTPSQSSNLILMSNSFNLFPNQYHIYFLLVIYFFLITKFFV